VSFPANKDPTSARSISKARGGGVRCLSSVKLRVSEQAPSAITVEVGFGGQLRTCLRFVTVTSEVCVESQAIVKSSRVRGR
jgi:hypothetical protein